MSQNDLIGELSSRMQAYAGREGQSRGFAEYLNLFFENPAQQCRSAAHYIRDTFDHFGSRTLDTPAGSVRRFGLFDAEFAGGEGRVAGQEHVQESIYQLLDNFVRGGRVNRLILLHGPNGSAKTSIIRAIVQAMEYYSALDEGALYHFRWLFPSEKIARSHIGFGEKSAQGAPATQNTFAHLPGEDLNAVLDCELKDHPLLLVPTEERVRLLEKLQEQGKLPREYPLPDYLLRGNLCAKCRTIYDALLAAYGGDCQMVLRHVQVRRLHLSLRYRRGVATVDPQMHVDAVEQQVTASQGLASLPPSIAHLALYEPRGSLVDANRGLLEYNDLLKRPIDTFKYLLTTCETGQVSLDRSTLFLDTVFLGSTNEMLLDSFKAYADFASFKGRLELVRVPYLRRVSEEVEIYRHQVPERSLGRHLAPHTLSMAALWAVLTRLKRPDASALAGDLVDCVRNLLPLEKARLYNTGETPPNVSSALARDLANVVPYLYHQSGSDYEGRLGASAREVRMLLMNAAQRGDQPCVTPLDLFDEILTLLSDTSIFEFLKQDPDGLYMNQPKLVEMVEEAYLDMLEDEAAEALGMVTEASYAELFNRYIHNVIHWLKKEKLQDPVTGQPVSPDDDMMRQVESVIRPADENEEAFRKNMISRIGAFALDAGRDGTLTGPPDYARVFPAHFERLKDDFFEKRQVSLRKNYEKFLVFLDGSSPGQDAREQKLFESMRETLTRRFGYCDHCAKQALAFLLKKRHA